MRITRLETVRIAEHPNPIWVLMHTDEGLTGLGETFFGAAAVEAHLHDILAPQVLGRDALAIERLARDLVGYLGFRSSGVETRAASAFDIALWDLFGKATGQPLAQLLGGFTRRAIRTYNTCAGPVYVRQAKGVTPDNFGLEAGAGAGELDDLDAFLHRADELALSLLEEGITGMKIWPFDMAAAKSGGHYISAADMKAALAPFEKIRAAVGERMEIMVELHLKWRLLPAIEIARALAPFRPFWLEDPLPMDSLSDLRAYAAAAPAPVAASETLAGLGGFRDLIETGVPAILNLDLSWCGGLTVARKIAAMAEAWHLPIAPHDCTGPVVLAASTHLSLAAPNALVQESVRAFHRGWYRDMVTAVPPIEQGRITVPDGPGLGLDLNPDLDRAFTVTRRVTKAAAV